MCEDVSTLLKTINLFGPHFCQRKLNEAFNNFSVVNCTHVTGLWRGADGDEVLLMERTLESWLGLLEMLPLSTWPDLPVISSHHNYFSVPNLKGLMALQYLQYQVLVKLCTGALHHSLQWEQGGGMAGIWPCWAFPIALYDRARREKGFSYSQGVCVSWVNQVREGTVHRKDNLWTSVVFLTGARKTYS